jgi:hypothetical protein
MTLLIFHDAFPRFTPLVVPIFLFLGFMDQEDRGGRTGEEKKAEEEKGEEEANPHCMM